MSTTIIFLQQTLWNQFGASIDMLANTIPTWPEAYWNLKTKPFYLTFHTALFLDYYLTIPPTNFNYTLPYHLVPSTLIPESAIDDLLPRQLYTQEELMQYVGQSRAKCKAVIQNLNKNNLDSIWIDEPDEIAAPMTLQYSVLEILYYNLRHTQHHAGQLNLLLRQLTGNAPDWIADVEELSA